MASTPVRDEDIQRVVDEIVARFRPRRVILFGSYAYGRPHADSDVDLLVEMETPLRGPEQATLIRDAVPLPFAADLLVRTPSQMTDRLQIGDPFLTEICSKGRILYEADHPGVGREG